MDLHCKFTMSACSNVFRLFLSLDMSVDCWELVPFPKTQHFVLKSSTLYYWIHQKFTFKVSNTSAPPFARGTWREYGDVTGYEMKYEVLGKVREKRRTFVV